MSATRRAESVALEAASVESNPVLKFSARRPIVTSLVLLIIALLFKWVDTFVLRLDERLGEIILSKTLGFVLVAVFVWAAGRTLRDIGLHARRLGASLLIGAGVMVIALVVAYGAEFALNLDSQPALYIEAIDPKAGVRGGLLFVLLMIVGNAVNAFMEEGLFRGLMIRLFKVKLSTWRANTLQAFLFGLWHLPWVLKWHQTGQIEAHGGAISAILGQFGPMLLIGLAWGYFYLKTDSLWVPWISHFLNNTVLNLVQITSAAGVESGMAIRGPVALLVMLLSMFLVKFLAERLQLPEVRAWGQWAPPATKARR